MLAKTLLTAAALASTALAAGPSVTVVIEASHGGAGNDLQNTTVTIPLNHVYDNSTALAEVSTLYLTGTSGTPYDSVTCTPFSKTDGSGKSGLPFNSSSPSFLSTNDVDVGSIVCISTSISQAPGAPGLGSSSAVAASTTSTTLITHTPSPHVVHSTVTSVTAANPTAQSATSSSASASASQSAGNAASALYLSGEFFGGLALAGFGVAFAL